MIEYVRRYTLTVKPDVLVHATLQCCDAMLQYWCASCSEQIAINRFNKSLSKSYHVLRNIFANFICQKRVHDFWSSCWKCNLIFWRVVVNKLAFQSAYRWETFRISLKCLNIHITGLWNKFTFNFATNIENYSNGRPGTCQSDCNLVRATCTSILQHSSQYCNVACTRTSGLTVTNGNQALIKSRNSFLVSISNFVFKHFN